MSNRSKRVTFYWIVVLLAVSAGVSWGFSRKPPQPGFVPGRVMVKFHDDVSPDRITSIVEQEGGTVKSVLASIGVHIIVLAEGEDVSDAVDRFSSYREVLYAEPVQKASPLEEK